MNILTTICKRHETTPNLFHVFWRNGSKKQGVLLISVEAQVNDREIAAELSALQWLLGHRSVFGVTQTGKGLQLTVSSGAIKKMVMAINRTGALKPSDISKQHLFPYARFLGHRFVGMDIEVSKDDSWIMPRSQNDIEELTITEALPEVINIPAIGQVEITNHAIEQYSARLASADASDLWRLLSQMVNGKLRRPNLGSEYEKFKALKYGEAGELWVNDDLHWGMILVPGPIMPRMVTVYAVKKTSVADRC